MSQLVDISGKRFGLLTIVGRSSRKSKAGAVWIASCDCGGSTETTSLKIRSGHTSSCGCKKDGSFNVTHGRSKNCSGQTYRSWKEMRQRCMNPASPKWKWYGGRGVSICERWNLFEMFLADMGERPKGHSIDRINPDGNYEPSNCRWATPKQQAETNRGCFKKKDTNGH